MEVISLSQIKKELKEKKVSSLELAQSCLSTIKEKDTEINAFITVCEEEALAEARASDQRRARGELLSDLDGIPYAAKDLYCTKGIKTTAGSRILENFIPPYDATVIKKLKSAGLVMLGKTNTDEFAMGSSTENSYFGSTKNPHDLERVPGGSSGGSAASVAAGQTPLALGTDTGGSIRQPASFCGVVGLKPTYGRVSRYGVVAYASSLDAMGAFANRVEDVASLAKHMAGTDSKDSTAADMPIPDYEKRLSDSIKGKKIAVPKEFFGPGFDPKIRKNFYQSMQIFAKLGCEIVPVSLSLTKYAIAAYYIIAKSEASTNLARYDGIRYGRAEEAQNLTEAYLHTKSKGFGAEVKRSIMMGTYTLSAGYYDAFYKKASQARTLIKKEYEEILKVASVIIAPVSPILPFKIGEKIDDPLAMYLTDVCTVSINLVGAPAIAIPSGKIDNLPVGLQIIGRHFAEEDVLNFAFNFQENVDF